MTRNVNSHSLPSGWVRVALSEIAISIQYGYTASAVYDRRGPRFLRITDIQDGKVDWNSVPSCDITAEELSKYKLKLGDLVFARTGGTTGKSFLLGSCPIAVFASYLIRIRLHPSISSLYVWRFCQSNDYWQQIETGKRGVGQPNVNADVLGQITIPLAPIEEQNRIAKVIEKHFSHLDTAVAALRRGQPKFGRYRESVLRDACENRLVPGPAKNWRKISLGELGKWCGGGTPSKLNQAFWNRGSIPWISPKDMKSTMVSDSEDHITRNAVRNSATNLVPPHSVLVVTRSGILKHTLPVAVCVREVAINQDIKALQPFDEYDARYIVSALKCYERKILRQCTKAGTTVENIELAKFLRFKIPIPTLSDQRRIVSEVERRFSAIAKLESSTTAGLKQSEIERQSILKDAFTGHLVPQNRREKPMGEILGTIRALHIPQEVPMTATVPGAASQSYATRRSPRKNGVNRYRVVATKLSPTVAPQNMDMKLVRLKLLDNYKSLKAGEFIFRNTLNRDARFSPVCLVGLNGSGKSNLIEALCEILCHLELSLLPYKKILQKARSSPLRFELEYELRRRNQNTTTRIRITKSDKRLAIFEEIKNGQFVAVDKPGQKLSYLPTRIIGYSSGLNETISIPFFRTQAYYAEEVRNRALDEERRPRKLLPDLEDTRALFMDYDSNGAILLANYLLGPESRLRLFRKYLRIKDIASFDVIFRHTYGGRKEVKLTRELKNYLACLRKCATEVRQSADGKSESFTFKVDSRTRRLFCKYFADTHAFFAAMYKLSLLNALALTGSDRKFYLRKEVKEGLLERPPTVSKKDKIFAIERLQLNLTKPSKTIDYAGISDGEHQFIQVFGTLMLFNEQGCLFLLDEPETHFNPRWRRRFVQILGDMRSAAQQEYVISTHSPFLVSGCTGQYVLKFKRKGDFAQCSSLDFETFGSSFDFLLTKLFDLEALIAEDAVIELKEILKSHSQQKLENAITTFGESFEKRFLYEKLVVMKKRRKKR